MKLEQDYIAIISHDHLMKTSDFCGLQAEEDADYLQKFSSEKRISTTLAMRNYCRFILSRLMESKVEAWKIKVNQNGRRYAVGPDLTEYTLSFTHSRHWIGIAISDGPIGIDIEELKAGRNWKEMLSFLKTSESTPNITSENQFLTYWTESEARFKYASAAPNLTPRHIHHEDIDQSSTLCIASNNANYHLEIGLLSK